MGAATALFYSETDPSIAGMILDSAFADLTMLAEEIVEKVRTNIHTYFHLLHVKCEHIHIYIHMHSYTHTNIYKYIQIYRGGSKGSLLQGYLCH